MPDTQVAKLITKGTFSAPQSAVVPIFEAPFDGALTRVRARSDTAPSGDAKFNVKVNGTSIWASSTNYVKIVASSNSGDQSSGISGSASAGLDAGFAVHAGDLIQVDLFSIAGGSVGAELEITVYVEQKNTGFMYRRHLPGSITPSATLGVYGAATTIGPPSGGYKAGLVPLFLSLSGNSLAGGGETLTFKLVWTMSDGSVITDADFREMNNTDSEIDFVLIGNGAAPVGSSSGFNDLGTPFQDGLYVSSVAISCKSSINSSAADVDIEFGALLT